MVDMRWYCTSRTGIALISTSLSTGLQQCTLWAVLNLRIPVIFLVNSFHYSISFFTATAATQLATSLARNIVPVIFWYAVLHRFYYH